MIDKPPRIALESVKIHPDQTLVEGESWRWGPLFDLPDGRSGVWAICGIYNVAVRCYFDPAQRLRDPSVVGMWKALYWAKDAEDRQRADAFLTGITDREAAAIKRQQARKAKKAAPLAAAVEVQLEAILRSA